MNPDRYRRLKRVLRRRQPDLTVLMEKVNKGRNFSAIVRNCDAVGVLEAHAVLAEKGIDLDPHTAAGATKWIRIHLHDSVGAAVDALHGEGFSVVAAHPTHRARDFREVDFTLPVALMVGAELDGLSEEGLALADEQVAIPMVGMVRSLNVSVATALLLFEAFRQRQEKGFFDESRLDPAEFDRILFEWAYPDIAEVLRRKGETYPALSRDGDILW